MDYKPGMSIQDILAIPDDDVAKMSNAELSKLLEHFYPIARKAVLPPVTATSKKETVTTRNIQALLEFARIQGKK